MSTQPAYAPPAFAPCEADLYDLPESAAYQYAAALAFVLAFYGATAAWCWALCRTHGGVRSCSVSWLTAKVTCRR